MGVIAKQSIRGTIVTYLGIAVGVVTTFFVLTRFLTTEEIGLARVLIDAATLFIGLAQLGTNASIIRFYPYFREKGNVSTFVGRFIPGIRQLISIPAGLSRMHFGAFLWWTFLGAFIWNCILAVLGYVAAGQMDLIKEYSHELSVAILILLGAVILYYLIRWIIKKRVKA